MNHTMTIIEINEINIIFYKKCAKREILKKRINGMKNYFLGHFLCHFSFFSAQIVSLNKSEEKKYMKNS